MKKRKLTKRQMAVAIARDVIAQLKAKKFIAKNMIYLGGDAIRSILKEARAGDELQDALLKKRPKCQVCALGSAFISAVRLDDKFKLTQFQADCGFIDDDDMRGKLESYFTRKELSDIEFVFEESHPTPTWNPSAASAAYRKMNARNLLTWIMEQIVSQKGHFDIEKVEKAAAEYK